MEGQEKLKSNITYEDKNGDNPFDKIEIYWPTNVIEVCYNEVEEQ